MKSGNINFLEPSGILLVWKGTDLSFIYIYVLHKIYETFLSECNET